MTETCPSCKSNDRDVRRDADCDGYDSPCTYSWHDAKAEKMADELAKEYGRDMVATLQANIRANRNHPAPAQATREQLVCRDCREPVIGSVHVVLVSGARMCFKCFNAMGNPPVIDGPAGTNKLLGGK